MPDPRERLARLEAALEAATPGPWRVEAPKSRNRSIWGGPEAFHEVVTVESVSVGYYGCDHWVEMTEADSLLIAESRNELPWLLAVAKAALVCSQETVTQWPLRPCDAHLYATLAGKAGQE